MVSETICLDIILALFGRTTTVTQTFNLADSDGAKVQKSQEKNALSDRDLVRPLLAKYDLSGIDSAIRWLTLGEYIGKTQWGIRGPWVHVLTTRDVDVAEQGKFADEERALFYLEEPHQVFLAHQFDQEDTPLELILRSTLTEAGYDVVDGRVDGLEQFRHTILAKLKKSRFFLCLLTRRAQLKSGTYVSSVWLYQEIGAAIGLGKKPLLLVEDGMDSHYAGELQKTYEYITFTRTSFGAILPEVIRRFEVDLEGSSIPVPERRKLANTGLQADGPAARR